MLKVLVAPDKFKGSCRAREVAEMLCAGIADTAPHIDTRAQPVADGGEGSLEVARNAGYNLRAATVSDPWGRPVEADYAHEGDRAIIEMARFSGPPVHGSPGPAGLASTRGTGEALADAIRHGARRITLALGGSATTDGGAGMVQALGARLTDSTGAILSEGGLALARLQTLEPQVLRRNTAGITVDVACDVDSPLLGPHGAARLFGPQKGAGPAGVDQLERALTHWADLVEHVAGARFRDLPGAGAAGGTGFAAAALLDARLRPGLSLMLSISGLIDRLNEYDILIVGEGSLDEQSLRGKAPLALAREAADRGVGRIVAVCGRRMLEPAQLHRHGVTECHALTDLQPDPARCMAEAPALLREIGRRLGRAWEAEENDAPAPDPAY